MICAVYVYHAVKGSSLETHWDLMQSSNGIEEEKPQLLLLQVVKLACGESCP